MERERGKTLGFTDYVCLWLDRGGRVRVDHGEEGPERVVMPRVVVLGKERYLRLECEGPWDTLVDRAAAEIAAGAQVRLCEVCGRPAAPAGGDYRYCSPMCAWQDAFGEPNE
jgi:hypothetical protein